MKLFLFLAIALILFNCSKKGDLPPEKSFCEGNNIADPPPPPGRTSHPSNYLKYKRNGKEIIFNNYPLYDENDLSLYTEVKELDSIINIRINGKDAVGKYTKKCNDFEVQYSTQSLKEYNYCCNLSVSSNTQPSSLIITQNDTILKGTFNFYLSNDSGVKASLTEGEFQIKKN